MGKGKKRRPRIMQNKEKIATFYSAFREKQINAMISQTQELTGQQYLPEKEGVCQSGQVR